MPIEIGERRSDDAIFKNGNWYNAPTNDQSVSIADDDLPTYSILIPAL